MGNWPIAILSFNRPAYLEQVLRSVAAQPGIERRPIAIFQDGAVNIFSRTRKASDAEIEANVALCRAILPHAILMPSPINLGVAMNFDRAERFMMGRVGYDAEAAVFLEDDLVLGPHYLEELDQMIAFALADPRIGYVTAYGIKRATEAQQRQFCRGVQPMGHNWAFGLTKRCWLAIRPWVRQYMEIVRNVDYRQRDVAEIEALHRSWGFRPGPTSQDTVKQYACLLAGIMRLNTYACFGRYIGAVGEHFTNDEFRSGGYDDVWLYPERVQLATPHSDLIARWPDSHDMDCQQVAQTRPT